MDKYEYKVSADEIKELIARGEYAQAAEIADTIDWRRVKSVMMLCTISDLYKINRRYEDARDMLLLAYERRPGGRTICYSLCELSIKTEEFVQAVEYYKEFVQVAPKDPGRYILQYKLYEAQDVSLEERIEVLEELKKRDYRERWAYELAYLYHRIGLATRCVEECDELILWFGEGKYVIKAMELKMLHQPLTPEQQEKYDRRFGAQETTGDTKEFGAVPAEEQSDRAADTQEEELYGQEPLFYEQEQTSGRSEQTVYEQQQAQEPDREEELDIHVKTMDVGKYNTINLQAELAAGLREVLGEEKKPGLENPVTRSIVAPMMDSDTESLDYPEIGEVDEEDLEPESGMEEMESSEVFFGETKELSDVQEYLEQPHPEEEPYPKEQLYPEEEPYPEEPEISEGSQMVDSIAQTVMEEFRRESMEKAARQVIHAQPPKELANVLAQESDGQISLVVPESQSVEKQITGQMNIDDILAEWERMKRENAEKNEEEVRRHVLEQTGDLFAEFDAAMKEGLLERLEREAQADYEDGPEAEAEPASEAEAGAEAEAGPEIEAEAEIEAEPEAEAEPVSEAEAESGYEPEIEAEIEAESEAEAEPASEAEADEVEELEEIEETAEPEDAGEEAAEAIFEEGSVTVEPVSAEAPVEPPADFVEREKARIRTFTKEEKELFAPYVQNKSAREQLVHVIDNITMAAYTGNVLITGEEGTDTLGLATNIIREIKQTDSNFSGKAAKISGQSLNGKNVVDTVTQLDGGALIIQKASGMTDPTVYLLNQSLQQEQLGIVVIMEDTKSAMDKFLAKHPELQSVFPLRMDVEVLSNDALVVFARQYAKEKEYSISELGVLALHTRIEGMQTMNHAVTISEVKELVDDAIHHAGRKTVGHFVDVLLARRYDDEDMIILGEKDFN